MSGLLSALALLVALVAGVVTGPLAGYSDPAASPPAGATVAQAAAEPETPGAEPAGESPTVTVQLTDNRFRPVRLTIPAGATVVWENAESDPDVAHNVISRDYRWASSDFLPGESYSHTFTAPGEYPYFCDLHGGMTGRIIVE